jgi:hypothetical protein
MRTKKYKDNKFKYPCLERMKLGYIYIAVSIVPILIMIKFTLINYENIFQAIKVNITMLLVIIGIFIFINIVQLYLDLLFIRRLSVGLANKICSVQDAWEAIYNRGMRLNYYILYQSDTALLIIKIMYEYGITFEDDEIKKAADIMYKDLENRYKDKFNIDIFSSSLLEVAKSTLNYLASPKNNSITRIFRVLSMPRIQIFIFRLFFIGFICFLIVQLIRLIITIFQLAGQ